ncbi:MAG: DUF1028 domain-containing protein [Acetobacteraceae bacterium]|nr:DUF1028 domain-containing protein [Acetobacteraceae bacterium]
MTFSIAALCRRTGYFGCALSTSSMAAGGRAMSISPDAGVVFSQARSDPSLGRLGIERLRAGAPAEAVLRDMREATPHARWRQLAVLDREGRTATATGESCTDAKGGIARHGVVAVGNGLANAQVVPATIAGFEAASDLELPERLLAALTAGEDAGGEAFPLRSAALAIAAPGIPLLRADLRVDFDPDPIARLRELLHLWTPMADGYVQRCVDPDNSPAANLIEGHA